MNRRELNVLQVLLVKKNYRENVKNESNSLKNIINKEYYRVENIDELQQVLNEIALNKALINTKEINKEIKSIHEKKIYNVLFEVKFILRM